MELQSFFSIQKVQTIFFFLQVMMTFICTCTVVTRITQFAIECLKASCYNQSIAPNNFFEECLDLTFVYTVSNQHVPALCKKPPI